MTLALALIALILAVRGDQVPASVTLTLALISLAVTWISYRRYQSIRDVRWRQEMANTEAELSQLLTDGEGAQVGAKQQSKAGQNLDQSEEAPLAGQ